MPPGHARGRHDDRHDDRRLRVGDRFDRDGRTHIDPRRYHLEERRNWSYFSDGNRAYRVDNDTQQIIAVLSLLGVLPN